MSEKSVARLQRENGILLEIAAKAIHLRHLGKQFDAAEKALSELWRLEPDMPRSRTQLVAIETAYQSRLAELDSAIAKAVETGIEFPKPLSPA